MLSILKSKWFLVIVILGISWLGLSSIKIKLQDNIVNKEVGDLEKKINNLVSGNSALDKLIGYLKQPSYLEKEARLKLNYKAPGEEVAFVYFDTGAQASTALTDSDKNFDLLPNYEKWFYYLIGRK